jgi:hypothetical protein
MRHVTHTRMRLTSHQTNRLFNETCHKTHRRFNQTNLLFHERCPQTVALALWPALHTHTHTHTHTQSVCAEYQISRNKCKTIRKINAEQLEDAPESREQIISNFTSKMQTKITCAKLRIPILADYGGQRVGDIFGDEVLILQVLSRARAHSLTHTLTHV